MHRFLGSNGAAKWKENKCKGNLTILFHICMSTTLFRQRSNQSMTSRLDRDLRNNNRILVDYLSLESPSRVSSRFLSLWGNLVVSDSQTSTFMMSRTAWQASSWSLATMTPFPAAKPLALTTNAGKMALWNNRHTHTRDSSRFTDKRLCLIRTILISTISKIKVVSWRREQSHWEN